MQHPSIRYLKRSEIDDDLWNNCIRKSINGTVYCITKYLDAMSYNGWSAIILGNYEAVLPLPIKKKYGIEIIYTPSFSQQTGIVFLSETDVTTEQKMLEAVPQKFRKISINLSAKNKSNENTVLRKNFILDISSPYENLKKNYSRLARRNIAKADLNNIRVTEAISPEQVLSMHRFRFNDNVGVHKKDYTNFLILMKSLCSEGLGFCFGATNANNEIIASSFYALYKNRLYFLLNGNLKESLEVGATHKLKDYVIWRFSGQNIIMDFEGSDNPNFSMFYKQFGAQEEPYARLVIDRMPWYLKMLKK